MLRRVPILHIFRWTSLLFTIALLAATIAAGIVALALSRPRDGLWFFDQYGLACFAVTSFHPSYPDIGVFVGHTYIGFAQRFEYTNLQEDGMFIPAPIMLTFGIVGTLVSWGVVWRPRKSIELVN